MKSLVLICFFSGIQFGSGEISPDVPCVVKYLKEKKLLSSTFASDLKIEPEGECDNVVDDLKTAFDRDVLARFQAESDQNCVLELFENYKISDFYLKGFVHHSLGLSPVSDFKNEAFESTRDTLKAVLAICSADEKYGRMFDEALKYRGSSKDLIIDDSSQQCVKKYYFDNKILNAEDFNVDLASINDECKEIYKNLDDASLQGLEVDENLTMYGLSSTEVQRCSNKRFVEEKVLLKLNSFEVAIKLDQTKENLNKLRSDYVQWNTVNLRFLLGCLVKLN